MKNGFIECKRSGEFSNGKPCYQYKVKCRVCAKIYWTKAYHKEQPRCKSCAGKQSYTPAKANRKDMRIRGDGYITKQGYHLIYNGEKYIPAHHFAFPDLPSNHVVHHIDGDKLNNQLSNLIALSKQKHRKAHGSLEKVSYLLIQAGLIEYNRNSNSYNLSTTMKRFMDANPVNSGKLLTDNAEDNPEPSQQIVGRCNDYPIEEYARSLVEAQDTQTSKVEGDDIVSSAWKHAAVHKRTGMD